MGSNENTIHLYSLVCLRRRLQVAAVASALFAMIWLLFSLLFSELAMAQGGAAIAVAGRDAEAEVEMETYSEPLEHTEVAIAFVPIPGGAFEMGSPDSEAGRREDEGPQHRVEISPFWMSETEITWDAYEVWMFDLDIQRRELAKEEPTQRDRAADEYQLSQPTPPYTDMTFGMGKEGFPAISMTQLAARVFCQWLTAKTGRYYRLPTEAEWEHACRAGTATPYSFGESIEELSDHAWWAENGNGQYQKVRLKKPNPWGLYDMHGNVSEWVLDQYIDDAYGRNQGDPVENPLSIPETLFPRVVRGGSWDDDPLDLRSAARLKSTPLWKQQDPQIPQSIWYHTDALHVGFRVVRPLREPSEDEKREKWDRSLPEQDRKEGR